MVRGNVTREDMMALKNVDGVRESFQKVVTEAFDNDVRSPADIARHIWNSELSDAEVCHNLSILGMILNGFFEEKRSTEAEKIDDGMSELKKKWGL